MRGWRFIRSGSQCAGFMNLNAVAKGIAYEEAFPRRWTAIGSFHAGSLQIGSQFIHIGTLKAEVPLRVWSKRLLLD